VSLIIKKEGLLRAILIQLLSVFLKLVVAMSN
jgi:hypothetical protein